MDISIHNLLGLYTKILLVGLLFSIGNTILLTSVLTKAWLLVFSFKDKLSLTLLYLVKDYHSSGLCFTHDFMSGAF